MWEIQLKTRASPSSTPSSTNDKDNHTHMALSSSELTASRVVIALLAAFGAFVIIYTIATDGQPFRKDVWAVPWVKATVADFYVNTFFLVWWIYYKEQNLVSRIFWILTVLCLGSPVTCIYVLLQFLKLRPGDSVSKVLLNETTSRSIKPKGK
eukprot:TRINITY_DN2090_c0_g1_i2.p1 TRINITY_DN2090_c0_g1~~TRINITY_DN2090_c0_g1_i2.p1  ORF type:complete len:153 (-),score=19.96 TRINITY_DN2090_c0_g1_i2:76-534(-)